MKPFSKTVFYRLPVISLCILIFWQSSYPGIISQPLFPQMDKLAHLVIYAVLAFLTARCLFNENSPISSTTIKITAILFTAAYGLSDEFHQSFIPERCASAYDFMADCTGAIIGSLTYTSKKN